ncbi:MAG: prephenate dehydrogenase [Candidatus Omnitrophota bacterium]
MKRFRRIAIIGTGLIGGSIGLAVRKKRLAREVVGVCRTVKSVRTAKKIGAVDWGTTHLLRALPGADLVILAAPIRQIPNLMRQLAPHLRGGVLVTDVSSAKGTVVPQIEARLRQGVFFVGSHPMAGREMRGPAFAIPTLFQGKLCFVIRRSDTSEAAFRRIRAFWKALGCRRVEPVTVEQHDRLVASFSHLPHLVAALLVLNAEKIELAGTGFRDMTRIVSSDPSLWQDILFANRKEILNSLSRFRKKLDRMASLLKQKKAGAILRQLQTARRLRDQLLP